MRVSAGRISGMNGLMGKKGARAVPCGWVKAARNAAGKTQEDLEELADVRRSTVHRWETGTTVHYVTWRGILSVLNLPEDWTPDSPPF